MAGNVLAKNEWRIPIHTGGASNWMISVDVHPGFPSRSEIQVDVHQASLEALAGTGVGSLFEALSWVFPLSTPGLGTIDIVGADVHPESYWHARASDPQWVRPVHLVIGVGERKAHFEVAVVPWLCDERATVTSTDLPGTPLGAAGAVSRAPAGAPTPVGPSPGTAAGSFVAPALVDAGARHRVSGDIHRHRRPADPVRRKHRSPSSARSSRACSGPGIPIAWMEDGPHRQCDVGQSGP